MSLFARIFGGQLAANPRQLFAQWAGPAVTGQFTALSPAQTCDGSLVVAYSCFVCRLNARTSAMSHGAAQRHMSSGVEAYQALRTIYALSTHAGRAAVAIIRISGAEADQTLKSLMHPATNEAVGTPRLPVERQLVPTALRHPQHGFLIDQAMAVRFKAPRSFTGEDVVELHVHGGPAVVSAMMEALAALPYLRLAEPGEFTRRAFLLGKKDLTEVEGLADLLAAQTEQQRALAVQNASGTLRQRGQAWRQQLLRCMAHLEAVIDFGDDEGLSEAVAEKVHEDVARLAASMTEQLQQGHRGELVRDGIQLAIIGPPNAGKSSLLNFLAQRDAAIVSPTPGTTRDVVTLALDLGGYKVTVMDTAGLRSGGGGIESEGMRRAMDAARKANMVVIMLDACKTASPSFITMLKTVAAAEPASAAVPSSPAAGIGRQPLQQEWLYVLNKSDLLQPADVHRLGGVGVVAAESTSKLDSLRPHRGGQSADAEAIVGLQRPWQLAGVPVPHLPHHREGVPSVLISLHTGENVATLMSALQDAVRRIMKPDRGGGRGEVAQTLVTRQRQRVLLQECLQALERYQNVKDQHELAAEELRSAAHALGKLTGIIDPEAVLDVLFAEFCIGK